MITRLLEERPGVQSSARLIALILTGLAVLIGLTMCYVAVYAIVHAKQHAEQASSAISAAGSLITQLTMAQGPVIGGIWIALGKRKHTPDDNPQQSRILVEGPAANQATVTPMVD